MSSLIPRWKEWAITTALIAGYAVWDPFGYGSLWSFVLGPVGAAAIEPWYQGQERRKRGRHDE